MTPSLLLSVPYIVAAEKERLKETGKYETTDDEMLKQEVQALFASI